MTLDDFSGMSWDQARGVFGRGDDHLLASMCGDKVVETAAGLAARHGPEAGAAYVAAALYHRKHGSRDTLLKAASMYEAAMPNASEEVRGAVENMLYWTAWAGVGKCNDKDFPMPVPEDVWMHHGGVMNFMLYMAISDSAGSTCEVLAAQGAADFLDFMCSRVGRSGGKKRRKGG